MHEQEVGGVLRLADLLRNTRCHRNRRNTSRTDQWVDLAAREDAHQFAEQDTARSTTCKRTEAHCDNAQRFQVQEAGGVRSRTDGDTEEDGDNIHQLILRRFGKTIGDA